MVSDKKNSPSKKPDGHKNKELEFGGPIGASILMIWSHYILFYFWYCMETTNGQLVIPTSFDSLIYHLGAFKDLFLTKAIPSAQTWWMYFLFFSVQLVLAGFVPGITIYGLPTAPDNQRLPYHCNGYLCYYICLWGFFLMHFVGWIPATYECEHYGEFLVAAMIIANVSSVGWYLYGLITKDPRNIKDTWSGNVVYDFFMGTILYPRIGEIDIKMVAEARWSWLTLMLLTLSCAIKQYETTGRVSKEMALMVYAHWLYSNATVKGEHYIPTTWDMFQERFGWMLNFWNVCGVPFLYCFQSFFILKNQDYLDENMSPYFTAFIFVFLTVGYYIFDTANCQKASCKVPGIKRNTFPVLPWGVLTNPVFLKTPKGSLLCDGWYRFARKMQYTGDIMMALSWGLACGFKSVMPYFYVVFFTGMIIHRQSRDEIRCKEKYGEYWDKYTKLVPNVFFPSPSFFVYLFTGKKPHVE